MRKRAPRQIKYQGRIYKRAYAQNAFDLILNPDQMWNVYEALEGDDQSRGLLDKIHEHFQTKLKLSSGEAEALGRLQGALYHAKGWDKATHRNNLFKAAHALGLPLPSSSF